MSYPVEIQAAGRAETCCCHSLLAAPPVGLFLTRSFTRQCPGRCHTCQWLTPTQATSQSCIESSYITPCDCSYSTDSPVYCVSITVPRPTKECIQFIWYWGWLPGKLCTCNRNLFQEQAWRVLTSASTELLRKETRRSRAWMEKPWQKQFQDELKSQGDLKVCRCPMCPFSRSPTKSKAPSSHWTLDFNHCTVNIKDHHEISSSWLFIST